MKNCEMILAGFAGQGILFTGKILAFAAMLKDKKLSWLPSYGPVNAWRYCKLSRYNR